MSAHHAARCFILAFLFMAVAMGKAEEISASPPGLNELLNAYVNNKGEVDYKKLKEEASPKLDKIARQFSGPEEEQFKTWPAENQIAYLINAYNVFTLKAIVENYPLAEKPRTHISQPHNSIRQIPGVWKTLKFSLMGKDVTLDHIEHEMLRKNYTEPRIHMGLVCASVGCPPLRNEAFQGARLSEQLNEQARKFFATTTKFRVDVKAKKVFLSRIFKWFKQDFVKVYGSDKPLLRFAGKYVDEYTKTFLLNEKVRVEWLDYDWRLNEAYSASLLTR